MLYPSFSALLANLSSNSSPSRNLVYIRSVKNGFWLSRRREKRRSCFGNNMLQNFWRYFDVFRCFYPMLGLFWAFRMLLTCIFNPEWYYNHPRICKKRWKMMSWSRLFGIFNRNQNNFFLLFFIRPVFLNFTLSKWYISIIWYIQTIVSSILYDLEHTPISKTYGFVRINEK